MSETRGIDWQPKNDGLTELGNNYLLAIGIDDYHHCTPLKNAVKDASDLVHVLSEKYLFEPQHVKLITNEAATEENILAEFENLIGCTTPIDNVVIFFSGHGVYNEIMKMGAWVPVDAKPQNRGDFIDNAVILNFIKVIDTKHIFLIADSCFSGSLFGTRDISVEKSVKHLQKVVKNRSRWALASGGNELVSDGAAGQNSPFTRSLIDFLDQASSPFSVSKLAFHVSDKTKTITHQTPDSGRISDTGDERGEMVFVPRNLKDSFFTSAPIEEKIPYSSRKMQSNPAGVLNQGNFFERYRVPLMTMAGVIVIAFILLKAGFSSMMSLFVFGTGAVLLSAFELFKVPGRVATFFKLATVAVIGAELIRCSIDGVAQCQEHEHWIIIIGLAALTTLFIVWSSLDHD